MAAMSQPLRIMGAATPPQMMEQQTSPDSFPQPSSPQLSYLAIPAPTVPTEVSGMDQENGVLILDVTSTKDAEDCVLEFAQALQANRARGGWTAFSVAIADRATTVGIRRESYPPPTPRPDKPPKMPSLRKVRALSPFTPLKQNIYRVQGLLGRCLWIYNFLECIGFRTSGW